jgi:predicted ester cyclase
MSMPPDQVMRTWFDEVWCKGQDAAIDRLMAGEAVAHGLPGGDSHGAAGFRQVFAAFRGAFPDIHITVELTICEGVMVTTRCRVSGTHTGDGLGIGPTGKPVDFEGMTIARVVDGQIREGWNCYDFLTMYQQMGVVAAPGA